MSNPAVLDVQTRITEIQTRINSISGKSTSSAANGAAFASTLDSLLNSTSTTSTAKTTGATGQDAVDTAKQWLGTPYVYGGNDPETGLDCSSLVQQAYKQLGIELPRVAADQAKAGTKVDSLAEAKPGDLVAFGSPVDHIGIYAGDNKMVVAPKKGDVVKIQEVYKEPTAIRRIIPEDTGMGNIQNAFASVSTASKGSSSAISSPLRSQYDNLFVQAGAKYNISPNLLAAVAKAESNFNASAKSGAGAQGLMQIMPGTAKGLGVNALDPTQAVDGAAKMLSGLQAKFGSTELALAGYNAGPGAVTKHGGIPPYAETQNYVKKIMSYVKGTV